MYSRIKDKAMLMRRSMSVGRLVKFYDSKASLSVGTADDGDEEGEGSCCTDDCEDDWVI